MFVSSVNRPSPLVVFVFFLWTAMEEEQGGGRALSVEKLRTDKEAVLLLFP
jgi:hypothetical protein